MTSIEFPILSRMPKTDCRYIVPAPEAGPALPAMEEWAQHWGLTAAVDGIAAYQYWVSRIVMPIVFEWIANNREDVYAHVPRELRDDIETVVHAAFEIVRQKDTYLRAQEELERFNEKLRSGMDTSHINPTWTKVAENLERQMEDALHASKSMPEPVR